MTGADLVDDLIAKAKEVGYIESEYRDSLKDEMEKAERELAEARGVLLRSMPGGGEWHVGGIVSAPFPTRMFGERP